MGYRGPSRWRAMTDSRSVQLDALIIGGGIAGLWTLDVLRRRGLNAVLIERTALGDGQTMWSQGILHGGVKYTLGGIMSRSAAAVRDMPERWASCMRGESLPDLREASVRSDHCYLWRTKTLKSRAGMMGARVGLRVAPKNLASDDRPSVLANCPGEVARLDEPVVDCASVLEVMASAHAGRVLLSDTLSVEPLEEHSTSVRLALDSSGGRIEIEATRLILCAGSGNAPLRERLGLDDKRMQIRPLHMGLVRGTDLPELNGHCVDGGRTRVTITSARDSEGRTVWQLGGEISERGVSMDPEHLVALAKTELEAVLPGVDLSSCEWSTYRADRAEGRTPGGQRPQDVDVLVEGPVISAWPTKLVLAPRLADVIAGSCPEGSSEDGIGALDELPVPDVATGPWDRAIEWVS